jgi:hypothetical protein
MNDFSECQTEKLSDADNRVCALKPSVVPLIADRIVCFTGA